MIIQISDDKKTKPVGLIKLNLGAIILEQEANPASPTLKGVLEKCPDKNATLEYSIKTTLISANAGQADCLSQMSEVLSNIDSGPESEYDF